MRPRRLFLKRAAAIGAALISSSSLAAEAPAKRKKAIPIILDTDIGTDVDDAFALALILASPELDLRGVTTVGSEPRTRALIVCRFLAAVGRGNIPVAAGAAPQPAEEIEKQGRYAKADGRPRAAQPVKESAVDFLYQRLKEQRGEWTLLAIGPLTNIARLLREHPDCKRWIRRIVLMAGSVRVGYKGKAPPETEWNVRCDIPAAQAVFASGVPLVVAPLDATTMLKLEQAPRRRLFQAKTPLTEQVRMLYELWGERTPTLYDPVAVALCFEERFCTMEALRLEVDSKGQTRAVKGTANARVATAIRGDDFLKWYVDRVAK
ncbi:MAG TPA: nucleoside hydrolase [Gemmataceae bacterium]|nr:nucleoside hydrolase [Gemmataceae bacterium]